MKHSTAGTAARIFLGTLVILTVSILWLVSDSSSVTRQVLWLQQNRVYNTYSLHDGLDNPTSYIPAPVQETVSKRTNTLLPSANFKPVKQVVEPQNLASTGTKTDKSVSIPDKATSDANFLALITEAEKHLGKPYLMGANGPNKFDCSSFVLYVFKHSGIKSLPDMVAQTIYSEHVTPVTREEARPGDIIFFKDTYKPGDGRIVTHVGIYVGNGTMIHSGDPLQYASIETPYWKSHFYAFGRMKP